MGSNFQLGLIHEDESKAESLLLEGVLEIKRIERILTEFDIHSYTSQINTAAGIAAIKVPEEVYNLVERSNQISAMTKGYFDITVGPLKSIYKFKNENFSFPENEVIAQSLKKVGYNHILLNRDSQTIRLEKEGMKISFAAIGKGYAADCVIKKWRELLVAGGYVNASGDLTAFGLNEIGDPWTVGICNPDNPEKVLLQIPVNNEAVATSGDYEQHFMHKGIRYSHNINPKTGLPVTGIKSVSVFSPSAELSDALTTALYTMGIEQGKAFVNQLPKTHAIFIDAKNKIHLSKKVHYEAVS